MSSFRTGEGRFKEIIQKFRNGSPSFAKVQEAKKLLPPHRDLTKRGLEKAAKLLAEAHDEDPDEPLVSLALAEVFWLSEERERAMPLIEAAVATYERYDPDHSYWLAHFYLGVLSLEEENAAKAALQLQKASDRLPDQPFVILLLAAAQEQNGQRRAAIQNYEKVLDITPRSSEINRAARKKLEALRG